MNSTKFWAAARNAALKVVAFWVLILAAYLALGRQFFPYIDQIKPEIEVWLTGQLGTNVEIGDLRGEWVRFNPVVYLSDVRFGNKLSVSKMTLAPGIYESIARGGPSFIRFEVSDFSAELFETAEGWQMSGFAGGSNEDTDIDLSYVLDLLRRQQEVQFTNTKLNINPLELPSFELQLNEGRLAGFKTDNGLYANATIRANGVEVPIELQAETTENASGLNRVYFKHGKINLTPWLKNINAEVSEAIVSGEYWINLAGEQWMNLTSRMDADSIVVSGEYDEIQFNDAKLETYLEYKQNGFEGWLNLLDYQLNGESFGSTQAKVSHRANRIKVQWDSMPASIVGHWFALTDISQFWNSISPQGYLEQGSLTLLRDVPNSLILAADVSNFSMSAHQAVPSLSQLDGGIRIEGSAGEMTLGSDLSDISFPNLFGNTFQSRIKQASLRWDGNSEFGLAASGSARFELFPTELMHSESDVLPVSLNWKSSIPTQVQKSEGRHSSLELEMTINQVNEHWTRKLVDSYLVDSNIAALINTRFESGKLDDLKINYLASSNFEKEPFNQFFINSNFKNTNVSFLDNWQSLEGLNGQLSLDQDRFQMKSLNGRYPGFSLMNSEMTLNFLDSEMNVEFETETNANYLINFLKAGPLRSLYGNRLDDWFAEGGVTTKTWLKVPLTEPENFDVHTEVSLSDTVLSLNDLDLEFDQVEGKLIYSTQDGLHSEGLRAYHENFRQDLVVEGEFRTDDSTLVVTASGKTPLEFWGRRFNDAFLSAQNAEVNHQTTIISSGNKVTIASESNLYELSLDLPVPFNKTKYEPMPIAIEVTLDSRGWTLLNTRLGNELLAYFELDQNNDIKRGSVAVGVDLNVRSDNGVFFDVKTKDFDGDDWWQAIQKIRALYASVELEESTSPSFESLIKSIQLEAEVVDYLAQPWSEAVIGMYRNDDAWLVDFNAEEGQGQVLIPHADEPIFADINWISITSGEENIEFKDAVDPLLAYSPDDIPNMQLHINKLIWNKKDLGNWRSEIYTSNGKLEAKNTIGEMSGAIIEGDLAWYIEEGKHQSDFVGSVKVANILDVLTTWQYAPVLTSREGEVEIDTHWQGSPAYFDFKRLQGSIDLKFSKGSILQVEEYEGVKLIGLLNFTRVIQRIALDFSDLLQTGISFDSIEGELLFDRGFARVGEKLVIDGSATKFKFSGDADLLSDELDIDMVLTVPLSSTFPLVALLAGVSPQAAAAIYVTERVFNNELERLSSARMHITGSFEDPVTKFYRVFDNSLGEQNPTVTDRLKDVVPEGVSQ
jgi:uncharacterized protein (TIGR02099 family)